MILAAVDDFLFVSKIRTTARQVGAEVVFVGSSDELIDRARANKPVLAVFDLNGRQLDPLSAIRRLKSDPDLAQIPTMGFVSHVQVDVVEAARAAGADEVLARSAFSTRLAEILSRGNQP